MTFDAKKQIYICEWLKEQRQFGAFSRLNNFKMNTGTDFNKSSLPYTAGAFYKFLISSAFILLNYLITSHNHCKCRSVWYYCVWGFPSQIISITIFSLVAIYQKDAFYGHMDKRSISKESSEYYKSQNLSKLLFCVLHMILIYFSY